jgi:hypothetical protein
VERERTSASIHDGCLPLVSNMAATSISAMVCSRQRRMFYTESMLAKLTFCPSIWQHLVFLLSTPLPNKGAALRVEGVNGGTCGAMCFPSVLMIRAPILPLTNRNGNPVSPLPTTTHQSELVQAAITRDVVAALRKEGYVIIDGSTRVALVFEAGFRHLSLRSYTCTCPSSSNTGALPLARTQMHFQLT